MSTKTVIMIGLVVGSTIGGYVPVLFGASIFSFASMAGSTVGALAGIYVGYQISKL